MEMTGKLEGIKDAPRLQWLDCLRGIAIILVAAFHFTVRYGQKYPRQGFMPPLRFSVPFGWNGVYLFFMISGFIIYLTIQTKANSTHFLFARLSRLFPPYWAAIALILLLRIPYSHVFALKNNISLSTVLLNIAMVPDIFHVPFLDGVFWSLFVELKFYVFFAILWKFFDMKNQAVFLISFMGLFALSLVHSYIRRLTFGDDYTYFLVFWAGIAACKVIYERMPIWIFSAILVLAAVGSFGMYSKGPELLYGIPVFGALFLLASRVSGIPAARILFKPFSEIGRISYSFYLIHQPAGYLLLAILSGLAIANYISIIIALICCGIIAWAGFRYVESLNKPLLKVMMRLVKKRGRYDKVNSDAA